MSAGWLAQANVLYKHGFTICDCRNAHLIDRMAAQLLVIFFADDIFAANWNKCLITINIAFKQDRILNFFQQKTCLCEPVFNPFGNRNFVTVEDSSRNDREFLISVTALVLPYSVRIESVLLEMSRSAEPA